MDCSDDLKVMMTTNLEQGKKFHESWDDPYLSMIRADEVYEKLGRVEKRELFTIESDEQKRAVQRMMMKYQWTTSMPYH